MGVKHSRGILGVELCADVPTEVGNLDNFHKVGGRIDTRTPHPMALKLIEVLVIELVAMAVAFLDVALGSPKSTYCAFTENAIRHNKLKQRSLIIFIF